MKPNKRAVPCKKKSTVNHLNKSIIDFEDYLLPNICSHFDWLFSIKDCVRNQLKMKSLPYSP